MANLFETVNFSTTTDSYNFIVATKIVLLKFSNPRSTEIPITDAYATMALKMAAQYKSLTTNTYCQAAITTFEADIARFKGQTVAQIVSEIQ